MNKKYLIIGGVIAAIGGIAWYANNQYKLTDKLSYSVTGYKIVAISQNGARVDLKIGIENKGVLKVKLKRLNLNIFSEGKFIATAFSEETVKIEPNTSAEMTIQMLLNPKVLLRNLGSVLLDASTSAGLKNIQLKIDGSLTVSKGGIPFRIPIIYSFKLSEFTEG